MPCFFLGWGEAVEMEAAVVRQVLGIILSAVFKCHFLFSRLEEPNLNDCHRELKRGGKLECHC